MSDFDRISDPNEFWKEYKGVSLKGKTLVIDYHRYINCKIEDCALVYGGGPYHLKDNHLSGCRWRFTDAAARSITLLQTMKPTSPGVDDAGNVTL